MRYIVIDPENKTITTDTDPSVLDSLYKMDHYDLDHGRTIIYFWEIEGGKEEKCMWKIEVPPLAKGFPKQYVEFPGKCIVAGNILLPINGKEPKLTDPSFGVEKIREVVRFSETE